MKTAKKTLLTDVEWNYPGSITQKTCVDCVLDGNICHIWRIEDKPIYVASLATRLSDYYEMPEDEFAHWKSELGNMFAYAEGKIGIVQLQPVTKNAHLYKGRFQPQRVMINWLKSHYDIAYILPAHRNLYMHPEVREHKVGKNPKIESLKIHYDQAATKCGFKYDAELELFVPKY
jgi:hypothetical protein